MIDELKVIDAVRELAAKRVPEIKKVYDDGYIPGRAERPSLAIEAVTTNQTPANKTLLHVEMFFTITAFIRMDSYDHAGARKLLELRRRVMDLFRCGCLLVDGRALNVSASTGGKDYDEAYVDLQLEFYDDRGGKPDPLPVMEEIRVNLRPEKQFKKGEDD